MLGLVATSQFKIIRDLVLGSFALLGSQIIIAVNEFALTT